MASGRVSSIETPADYLDGLKAAEEEKRVAKD